MKDVTIVLPVCCLDDELEDATMRCLRAIWDNTSAKMFNFIVVENGSVRFGIEYPESYEPDDVYVQSAIPLGAARPFNMGVALARTRYVVFMSNDVYVKPGWLEGLLSAYKDYGPGIIAPEEAYGRPDFTPNVSWGACFITERYLWRSWGEGWDEKNFPWRYCDQDMAIKLKRQGYTVGRTGRAVVEHKNMLTVNKMMDVIAPHAEQERQRMIEMYGAEDFAGWLEKVNGKN